MLLWLLLAGACAPAADGPPPRDRLVHEMLEAEDGRPTTREGLEPLLEGLQSQDPELRRLAVRGLGRQERPDLVPDIRGLIEDADPEVRRTAVDALAQAASRGDATAAIPPLLMRLTRDPDAGVRGAAADALGRLPYPTAELARDAADTLLRASRGMPRRHGAETAGTAPPPPEVLVGVSAGLESLLRRHRDRIEPGRELLDRLRAIALDAIADAPVPDRARRLALRTLVDAGVARHATLATCLDARDPQLRRIAATGLPGLAAEEDGIDLLDVALEDDAPMVRIAAIRATTSLPRARRCPRLLRARDDAEPHVALAAIDGLDSCPGAADALVEIVEETRSGSGSWHRPAHALVALAATHPRRSLDAIEAAARSDLWPLRMYAARAATAAAHVAVLETLADDAHPNVVEAALGGLAEHVGHAADPRYLKALESSDDQLLITAAASLAGTPRAEEAVTGLLSALERISAQERETSRDARLALLERIDELATAEHAEALLPYLTDFDPRIAEAAAASLGRWTGGAPVAEPRPLPREPVPTPAELRELAAAEAVVRMADGAEFTLELLPWEAPTNAARFARLARSGYFDGLTFHRVVPNFVIQGGSPGANEYAGDGPYTRDELTRRPHLRGTVGVSTRGRDTGDGQIFVNLIDNPRLDHEYTIFARVREGMDAVDAILEADAIDTVIVRGETGAR